MARKRILHRLLLICLPALSILACFALYWWFHQQLPDEILRMQHPSSRFFDRHGTLISIERGYDHRWIFPVTLDELPRELLGDLIALEDRNFYHHHGIDYKAMARAFFQMLFSLRRVSGGSTITMQVVNIYAGKPEKRTILYKLRQMAKAWNLERRYTKDEVLTLYLNMLPCGGKIYGIEAAAQYYFGRPARNLTKDEQMLLIGLPQRPNSYRPDLHPALAMWRRNVVLQHLRQRQRITTEEADAMCRRIPRFRDFSLPPWPSGKERMFTLLSERQHLHKGYTSMTHIDTSLDLSMQQRLRAELIAMRNTLTKVRDGAGIILDNATGDVLALVGTLPDGTAGAEEVNAALARRSTGSTLKPFIYGEALHGGIISPDTLLEDTHLAIGPFQPGNFDGIFRGKVKAADALSQSLNIPAIRLLQDIGPQRIITLLQSIGLANPLHSPEKLVARYGLTLAIGGAECSLLDIASAYAHLGRTPRHSFLKTQPSPPSATVDYWHPEATALLMDMLRRIRLKDAPEISVAWKSGTSNGNRDAWCIAMTPSWTVGIWFGNKDGQPSKDLVGGTAAVPVAARMLFYLQQGIPPHWPQEDGHASRQTELCAVSGLTPSPFCDSKIPGTVSRSIPLRTCSACRNSYKPADPSSSATKEIKIISPAPGKYLCRRHQSSLSFTWNSNPEEGHLYLDHTYHGLIHSGDTLKLEAGEHLLQFYAGGKDTSTTLEIIPQNPQDTY